MRVKFRIGIEKEGKRLKKKDLQGVRDPLYIGMRYITEFKYLEATKWLLLAKDSYEKYKLLALINEALGQNEQAREFEELSGKFPRVTDLSFVIEIPEKNFIQKV
ncbi:hypothetical protein [Aquifex aeolicus]|uniref:hypothetical protein n=1 Tax=Aquifex aeolicus TaxID=63363 RepID=UPI0003090412|nr:hypothetical protein [Aquifex aeolicus]